MSKQDGLTSKGFEYLLALFSTNREEAGESYEAARIGLERFFRFKGCADSAALADETMDRVAAKLEKSGPVEATPLAYLLGFASNIVLEYRRKVLKEREYQDNWHSPQPSNDNELREVKSACLNTCLARLSEDERQMLVSYFTARGREKERRRDELCVKLGCTAGALYTQIFRLKLRVRGCIQKCLKNSL